MKLLEERIRRDGKVLPGDVLKVDSFVNHQIDVDLMDAAGAEFFRLFGNEGITKILTIEASGIGIACLVARHFHVPVVFAKKLRSSNLAADVYAAEVRSYTHGGTVYQVVVAKDYLRPEDRVLLIDDFLATGEALRGLRELVRQAGATAVGAGIIVEKAYQSGGNDLRSSGLRVESLARVAAMDPESGITFCD